MPTIRIYTSCVNTACILPQQSEVFNVFSLTLAHVVRFWSKPCVLPGVVLIGYTLTPSLIVRNLFPVNRRSN